MYLVLALSRGQNTDFPSEDYQISRKPRWVIWSGISVKTRCTGLQRSNLKPRPHCIKMKMFRDLCPSQWELAPFLFASTLQKSHVMMVKCEDQIAITQIPELLHILSGSWLISDLWRLLLFRRGEESALRVTRVRVQELFHLSFTGSECKGQLSYVASHTFD